MSHYLITKKKLEAYNDILVWAHDVVSKHRIKKDANDIHYRQACDTLDLAIEALEESLEDFYLSGPKLTIKKER